MYSPVSALIIDADPFAAEMVRRRLMSVSPTQLRLYCCGHGGLACGCPAQVAARIVFIQQRLDSRKGTELIGPLGEVLPEKPLVIVYANDVDGEMALDALRAGAVDCINPVASDAEWSAVITRALEKLPLLARMNREEPDSHLRKEMDEASLVVRGGLIQSVTRSFLELSGHSEPELVGVAVHRVLSLPRTAFEEWLLLPGDRADRFCCDGELLCSGGTRIGVSTAAELIGPDHSPAARVIVWVSKPEAIAGRLTRADGGDVPYRELFAAGHDAAFLLRDGRIVDVNPAAGLLLGCSREEILGADGGCFTPNQVSFVQLLDSMCSATEAETPEEETVLKRRDGSLVEVRLDILRIQPHGETLWLVARDITAQRRARDEAQKGRQRYELAVEGSGAGIWDWDARHNELYVSAGLLGMLGLSRDEGFRDISELLERVHPGDRSLARSLIDFHLGDGSSFDVQFRVRHANGEYRWLRHAGAVLADERANPGRLVAYCQDITLLKQQQEERWERETHLNSLDRVARTISAAQELGDLAQAMVGLLRELFEVDVAWLLQYRRDEPEDMSFIAASPNLDEAQSRLVAGGLSADLADLPDDRATVLEVERQCTGGFFEWLREHGVENPLLLSVQPAGGSAWVLVLGQTGYPKSWTRQQLDLLREIGGRLGDALSSRMLWRALQEDIAERRLAEEELRQHRDHLRELVEEQVTDLRHAKEVAESAMQTMSLFLANMSHELRTPLHAILGFSRLGQEKATNSASGELENYFLRIKKSGEQLLSLLNDLLELSQLEAGRTAYRFVSCNFPELVAMVVDELEIKARNKQLRIEIHNALGKPDVLIQLDRHRITQALRNLVGDAIGQSHPNGVIRVEQKDGSLYYTRGDSTVAAPAVTLCIFPNGAEIPVDRSEQVFDSCFRAGRDGVAGNGLGLAICRAVIAAHGGEVGVEHSPEHGPGLYFTIPVQSRETAA